MSRRTIALAAVCVISLFTFAGRAADEQKIPTPNRSMAFSAVTTKQGPMIEVTTNQTVFHVPYLVFQGDDHPFNGTMRPAEGRIEWTHHKGSMTAKTIRINPKNPRQ
jgi:hypothetical protein